MSDDHEEETSTAVSGRLGGLSEGGAPTLVCSEARKELTAEAQQQDQRDAAAAATVALRAKMLNALQKMVADLQNPSAPSGQKQSKPQQQQDAVENVGANDDDLDDNSNDNNGDDDDEEFDMLDQIRGADDAVLPDVSELMASAGSNTNLGISATTSMQMSAIHNTTTNNNNATSASPDGTSSSNNSMTSLTADLLRQLTTMSSSSPATTGSFAAAPSSNNNNPQPNNTTTNDAVAATNTSSLLTMELIQQVGHAMNEVWKNFMHADLRVAVPQDIDKVRAMLMSLSSSSSSTQQRERTLSKIFVSSSRGSPLAMPKMNPAPADLLSLFHGRQLTEAEKLSRFHAGCGDDDEGNEEDKEFTQLMLHRLLFNEALDLSLLAPSFEILEIRFCNGKLPDFRGLQHHVNNSSCSKLTDLIVSVNHFRDTDLLTTEALSCLPPSLSRLRIIDNSLRGHNIALGANLPKEIDVVSLACNSLTGQLNFTGIDEELKDCGEIDVHGNNFDSVVGLDSVLRCASLHTLNLGSNPRMQGQVPFGALAAATNPSMLQFIHMRHCQLNGALDLAAIANSCKYLRDCDLAFNQFSAASPTFNLALLSKLRYLEKFDVNFNPGLASKLVFDKQIDEQHDENAEEAEHQDAEHSSLVLPKLMFRLGLAGCGFTGDVTSWLSPSKKAEEDHQQEIKGSLPPLPDSMRELALYDNPQLEGTIERQKLHIETAIERVSVQVTGTNIRLVV